MLLQKLIGANAGGGIEFLGYRDRGIIDSFSDELPLVSFESDLDPTETDPIAGDLVLVFYSVATDNCSSSLLSMASSGWTVIANLFSNYTYENSLIAAYKFMGGTPDATVNFGVSGTGYVDGEDSRAGTALLFRGVDPSTPLDVPVQTATRKSVRADPPSITPTTEGSFIVATGSGSHREAVQTFSCSNMPDFTSVGVNSYNDTTIGSGVVEWVSGVFDPAEFTFSDDDSASNAACAITLALRPA